MKVEANGIRINYELSGNENGAVVVLSHSLGCSMAMWDPQLDSLERNYRVLRYDTRGHGFTDASPGAYTLDMLGRDVIGLLEALGIDVVHWVGLSMGGMIGQWLALNYPNLLQSLALCDTAATVPEEAQSIWQERINLAQEKGMTALVESTLERWFTQPYLSMNPPVLDRIRKQFISTPAAGYTGCCEAIRRLNYLERISEIQKPTLIIVGEEDPATPVDASKAMHDRIANSRLVVLSSAAHLSNVEQSEAFNNALMGFLSAQ